VLQDDRNLVVYAANSQQTWASGTGLEPEPEPDEDPVGDQQRFLESHPARALGCDNEAEFLAAIADRILVMHDFPCEGVVVLVPYEIDDELLALSHRWDSDKMTFRIMCVVELGGGDRYWWYAKTQRGLRHSLLKIPNSRGHLWMDQLCIPQV
jgi:hypothetical protein